MAKRRNKSGGFGYRLRQLTAHLPAILVFILGLADPQKSFSQEVPEFDEVLLFLDVKGIGGVEVASVIRGEEAYLSIPEVFSFLKIKNTINPSLDSVSGFVISPEAIFVIDHVGNTVTYGGEQFRLRPGDLIRTASSLYLKTQYFGEIFGLDCRFNFRSLTVTLVTKLELPAIREMRQEMMRQNIQGLRSEKEADTTIPRSYRAFHFGMADWSVISTQVPGEKTDTRATLSLGSVIAGGEANVTLNYSTAQPFRERDQQYIWRFVNNEFNPLRQTSIGKIDPQSTSTIYDPVVGIQLTNTPTRFRKAFGTYTLADRTEPGWIVELFVNNVLVDYTKADASGFFTFEVPLVYGNTEVKLRFYGPWGEERSREQNITIPFNFLPHKEFEYTLSGGMVEDSSHSIFSRGNLNYGLTKRLTIGAGAEYLSSVTSGTTMPFANFSMRIADNLLLSGEYTYGVRAKGVLNYRLPSDLQFEIYYSWYDRDQTAINYNYREQRKFIISMPIRGKHTMMYSRLTVDQIILPESRYTNTELMFSGAIFGVNTNFSTYALFTGPTEPYVYSRLSLGFRLPARMVLTPQAQFEYNNMRFVSVKLELEKHLLRHGYLNLAYEQGFKYNFRSLQLTFRYDLPFAQTTLTARQSSVATTLIESARGSLMLDAGTDYIGATNRINVGKGGIAILPFFDLNCNGVHEPDEPRVQDLGLKVTGGRIRYNQKDTVIRIYDLEPYTSYLVELDQNSLDNIAWQLAFKTLRVNVDPNSFKHIEVPVNVFGEAAGMVYLKDLRGKSGLGRIIVNIYSADSTLVRRTISEPDGFFSYLGLKPGRYFAALDSMQLSRLGMAAEPVTVPFTVQRNPDGDYIDGLTFILSPETKEGEPIPDTTATVKIQAGAFGNLANAESLKLRIQQVLQREALIVSADGYYKVIIEGFRDEAEAERFRKQMADRGFRESFIIK